MSKRSSEFRKGAPKASPVKAGKHFARQKVLRADQYRDWEPPIMSYRTPGKGVSGESSN